MHIILVILKIIGITVLVLLGIILTLSLLILFVPVRYSVRADFNNDASLGIHFTWLAGILRCRISYPKGEPWICRLFGIPIARGKRAGRKKTTNRRRRNNTLSGSSEQSDSNSAKKNIHYDSGNEDGAKRDAGYADAADKDGADSLTEHLHKKNRRYKKERRRKKANHKDKKKKKNTFKTLFGILGDERNKRLIVFLKDVVIQFLKRVRPRKIKADMVIGFDDPACTGLFFGGLGILTVCWTGKYNITPDFEKKILKGSVRARGYVRVLDVLRFLLKILLNEDIKRVMKKGQVN